MNKVLFVATTLKKHIVVFHLPYLEWFQENGYEVHVCARNDYQNDEDFDIPFCDQYYDLPFERSPYNYGNKQVFNDLKKIIDENDYSLIHCHTPMGGVLSRLAARRARRRGTIVVYTAHGFHFYNGAPWLNWMLYYPIEKWLARYTDVLITINKEDYERAKRSFKAGRIEYVPGVGVDVEKYGSVVVDRKAKRKELGLAEDDFVLVSTGELNDNKNHKTVIQAVHRLNNLSVKYLICGQGPLKNELLNLVQELGLEHQVMLLGYRTDIIEINHIADVFVFPSFREGLSVALMEAMACGLPVVCSDIRGNRDLIEDGKGGFLVVPEDVEGFAKSLESLLEKPNLTEGMGKHNLVRVRDFGINVVLKQMKDIYNDV